MPKKILFFLTTIFFTLGVALMPHPALALHFSGIELSYIFCNCSGNFLIFYMPTVPQVMPKALSYRPGASLLFPMYQIFKPGAWLGGRTTVPDVCIYGGECENQINYGELIWFVGTSF